MKILNHKDVHAKIRRLSYQILEEYIDDKEVYFLGINNNGSKLRDEIIKVIGTIEPKFVIHKHKIILNPADPLSSDIETDIDLDKISGKRVLIVDDVASTGRTLFYAASIFKNILVESIKMCVLVDRQHKSFPIHVDFVGLSLATTVNDDILVDFSKKSDWRAQIV